MLATEAFSCFKPYILLYLHPTSQCKHKPGIQHLSTIVVLFHWRKRRYNTVQYPPLLKERMCRMSIDLKAMKSRLEAKRDELQRNIAGLTEAHPQPVDPIEASEGPQDFEEVAVDFLETQQEQSLLVNEQALLTEVQSALERIENGTYGKCIDCGQPIPEKRLEAIPWAARCVKDEERLEESNLSITETYDEELD